MTQFLKSIVDLNKLEDIKHYIEDDRVVEIHLAGLLLGVTIFKDRKKPGTICIAFHRKIECTNTTSKAIEIIKKEFKTNTIQNLKAIVFSTKT